VALPQQAATRRSPREPLVLIPIGAQDVLRRSRRLALTAVLMGALGLGGIALAYKRSVDPLHARESYDSGVRLLRIARYNQAALAFDRAVGLKPDFADAFLMRGKAFAADSRIDQAIFDFTRVIELQPSDPRGWLARGATYFELKKFSLALADAERAIALDRRMTAAYNLRGLAERSMGDARRAIGDFDAAVALEPNVDNHYQRGATYQMLDEHARAIADMDRVIELRPGAPLGYLARAQSRRAIGDFEGAQADQIRASSIEGR
jgi:tetratricopeptide (TPR) repeat protein